jgi:hypothetical protein
MSALCKSCGQSLGRARLVINSYSSICPDCAYENEYGEVEHKTPVEQLRAEPVPIQSEGLFPLPPPVPNSKR